MTLRELIIRLMEAGTDLDDEALVRIVTRASDSCVVDAQCAPVRIVALDGRLWIERSELQGDIR